jgi:ABC-2 type transport system ATP-binding protein
MDAIRTDALTKHYHVGFWRRRPYVALDALTLNVRQGEVFGFLGPNGAGKTTTLKLLMQLIYPTSGHAEILGRPVGDVGVRRRIGYLPENPYFYDYLTAEELLGYFAGVFGYSAAERRRRVSTLLEEVGIGAERRLQLRKFSKGMLQRIGIAQALINDPEVVFFDEPMSGLDPLGRREIRELILRLRDRGCTVFFSSHVLADAETLCSRVAIVAGGRLAAAGDLRDLLAFRVQAWELVVSGVTDAQLEPAKASGEVTRVTPLGSQRFALEVPLSADPGRVMASFGALGAQLVSLNPVRETLEDFFVRQIASAPSDRGLEPVAR